MYNTLYYTAVLLDSIIEKQFEYLLLWVMDINHITYIHYIESVIAWNEDVEHSGVTKFEAAGSKATKSSLLMGASV